MKRYRCLAIVLAICLSPVACFSGQGDLQWFSFKKNFVSSNFASDSAIGTLAMRISHRAGNIHSVSCGGNDGELHIGMTLDEIDLSNNQMPLSLPIIENDDGWGIVAELPNATGGNGPSRLNQLANRPVAFSGYFRVWNEGHARGTVHPSNPHHVFEVHPAWGFTGQGVSFERKDLVDSMPDFRGFGASKFKPLFKSMSDGDWPLAFQEGNTLHVKLREASNFFQLPVRVREVRNIQGGHEVTVDVFSDRSFHNKVFEGLRCITVEGSPVDNTLGVGDRLFLLGIFSVNLRKALEASNNAHSEVEAVAVADAVEFFVFGEALRRAVTSCTH